jgi:hypothetical protein
MICQARLKAWTGDDGLFSCRLDADGHQEHIAPGLFATQTIHWLEGDRRQFTGDFHPCDQSTCLLPAGHHGNHAS